MNHWVLREARRYPGHAGSRLDEPSLTIKAGAHGVAGGENMYVDDLGTPRHYTLRECARLQGFPDTHIFVGRQISSSDDRHTSCTRSGMRCPWASPGP